MSWASLHIDFDDEIRPAPSQTPGYAQVHLGEIGLMMRTAKARELHAVLGEVLAAAEDEQGGA